MVMTPLGSASAEAIWRSRLLIVVAAIIWSTGGAAVKISDLTAPQIAGGRSIFAGLTLFVLFRGARRLPTRETLLAGLFYAATGVLFVFANTLTTAGNTIFLQNTAPVWVLLLSPWFLGEKNTRAEQWSVPISLAGSVLFFVDDLTVGRWAGNACALGASISYALLIMTYRRMSTADGLAATVHGNVIIVLGTSPYWFLGPLPSLKDIAVCAYLGAFQQAGGAVLFTTGIRGVSALEGALLILFEPLLSPVWAYWAVGETLGPLALAGAGLILGATVWRARKSSG